MALDLKKAVYSWTILNINKQKYIKKESCFFTISQPLKQSSVPAPTYFNEKSGKIYI